MTNQEKVAKLVESSFLPAEQKRVLAHHIQVRGVGDDFWRLFDQALAEELRTRTARYQRVMEKFTESVASLERTTASKRHALQEQRNAQLRQAGDDATERERVLEAYQETLNELLREHIQGLQNIVSKVAEG